MIKIETGFEGLFIIESNIFNDNRGSFHKLFNFDWFKNEQLETEFKEFYYSISKKNVLRGMHFQLPPHEHSKLVYVSNGSVLDVALDLRKNSKTFGKAYSVKLDSSQSRFLYIPVGFAHGFLSLEENTIVNYAQTSCYDKDSDSGVLYNSFGFDWGINKPIVSIRDESFNSFVEFNTIF